MGYCEPVQEDTNASSINVDSSSISTNASSINISASDIFGSGSSDVGEGEGEGYYVDDVRASYNCARDDTSVTNAYAEYEGVNYAIDLMLVTLCLAVAFTRAGYTEYLKRGKSGAKGAGVKDLDDEFDSEHNDEHFHSVRWWLYHTFKSQDFRESIEVCFGAALNIIDLQGVEPETRGIYDWVLVVIFIQLLFVLAGENLILALRIVWRRVASFCNVQTKLGATQFDVDGTDQAEEGFEDTEQGKFLEMIFVHLSTLILRCALPMDPGNAVFILYAFINVIPLFVKLIVEGKRAAGKAQAKAKKAKEKTNDLCGCASGGHGGDEDEDRNGNGIPDADEKLQPLTDAIKDSNQCNYLTPEFHFDNEFDKADIDDSGGLNKSEFYTFLKYVFRKQKAEERDPTQGVADSLFDQISQSVKDRVENKGDPRLFHERFKDVSLDDITKHVRVEEKEKLLTKRKESISGTDHQHRALEDMSQLVRIVTKQDILIGCVKYFDESSRDWLYLNQARSLLQFVKRGRVYINDQDDVMNLSDDEKHYRVMAAIDLCNGVLERHDIRKAGPFCGNPTSDALDSLKAVLDQFSDIRTPTKPEIFAYRSEGVAIIKANLYKVAALHSDIITPRALKKMYKVANKGSNESYGPWDVNLTHAYHAMEQMERTATDYDWDKDGHTEAIRKWFDNEAKAYTSCKEVNEFKTALDGKGIEGMDERNQRHSSVASNPAYSNSPPNSPTRARPMSQVSQNDLEFHNAAQSVATAGSSNA